jgi:hypothetical protein
MPGHRLDAPAGYLTCRAGPIAPRIAGLYRPFAENPSFAPALFSGNVTGCGALSAA